MIELLNRYFVPVYSSNEDFWPTSSPAPAERAERARILAEFARTPSGAGAVQVYILTPDGHAVEGMHVAEAVKPGRLVALLERAVARLHTPPGEPVVKPARLSVPPRVAADAAVLHVSAKGFNGTGSWRTFPAENWIVLSRAEWMRLLPEGELRPGVAWQIEPALTRRLLNNFYPQTEDPNTRDRNQIELQSLQCKVISIENGVARARIEGRLKMLRAFHPGANDILPVDATLVGVLEFDARERRIRSLELVTDHATYGTEEFGAALDLAPPAS